MCCRALEQDSFGRSCGFPRASFSYESDPHSAHFIHLTPGRYFEVVPFLDRLKRLEQIQSLVSVESNDSPTILVFLKGLVHLCEVNTIVS